jgi:hypothetical protein
MSKKHLDKLEELNDRELNLVVGGTSYWGFQGQIARGFTANSTIPVLQAGGMPDIPWLPNEDGSW